MEIIAVLVAFMATPFVFWGLIVLSFIFVVTGQEYESGPLTTISVIFGAVVLWLGFGAQPITAGLSWLASNWFVIALCAIGYVVVGPLYAIAKWNFWVRNQNDKLDEMQPRGYDYRRGSYASATLREQLISEFATKKTDVSFEDFMASKGFPPDPLKNKALITLWVIYWPWSGFWTLINDPLRRFYKWSVKRISGILGRISAAVFANRMAEMKTSAEVARADVIRAAGTFEAGKEV